MSKIIVNRKRIFFVLSSIILTVVAALCLSVLPYSPKNIVQAVSSENKQTEPEFESNTILIKLKEDSSNILRSKISQNPEKKVDFTKGDSKDTGIDALNSLAKEDNFKEVAPAFSGNKEAANEKAEQAKEVLNRWYKITLNKESKQIKGDSAEYSDLQKIVEKLTKLDGVANVSLNGIVKADLTPNDTYYSSQYAPALIHANDAWDITEGSSSAVVGVLDTGIFTTHEDLGYSRIINQVDFTGSSYAFADVHGHGTHVAGIVAANINNSKGVTGIAPGVSLLNVKVLGDTGTGSVANLAAGIVWATDHNADVVSMSLGANLECDSSVQAIQDAIDYAYGHDVVVVAAAGNDGANDVHMPGNCNHVISVAATESDDSKASYSNYGTAVDIAAPGTLIISTLKDGTYGYMSGTSMATPAVSAVAALVRSVSPTLPVIETTERVLQNADAISGTGTNWSNGRVNAYKAIHTSATGGISASANPCQIAVGAYQCTSTITWSTSSGAPNVKITIRENPGTVFAAAVSGSQNAPWITTSGATFDLYSNGFFLDSVHVWGNPPGTISASPNPCTLSGGFCTSAITWSTVSGTPSVTVKIRETGGLFAAAVSGTQNAPWITSGGFHFDLYSGTTLISSVFVTGH